jgi:hypothetical protein
MPPRLLPLWVWLCGVGCIDAATPAPRPLRVEPSSGASARPLEVEIEGDDFNPEVHTDFAHKAESELNAGFRAFLGEQELSAVALAEDGTLHAVIPQGLPTGTFELRVVSPTGQQGVLANAFRVVTSAGSAAAFLIEPLGPQRAGVPFPVGIAALDAEGRVVEAFTGEVQLSARDDTVTPAKLGPFVLGRLRGAQIVLATPASAQQLTVEDGAGHRGESGIFAVVVGPPQRISVAGPPRVAAGACAGPFVVTLLDAAGNAAAFDAPSSLSVTAAPAQGAVLFEDSACVQATDDVQLVRGSATADFFCRFDRSGALSLELAAAGLPSVSALLDVDAGVATQLGFVTPSRVVSAGACSGEITVTALDALGNPTLLGAPINVTISAAPDAGVTLFVDACVTPLTTSLILGPSAGTATVRLSAPTPGQYELQLSASGLAGAKQAQHVGP